MSPGDAGGSGLGAIVGIGGQHQQEAIGAARQVSAGGVVELAVQTAVDDMYHGEPFLIAGLKDGLLCRRDKRRDEHRTAVGFIEVFLHFLLYLFRCQVAMTAHLEALGIGDEERVADGGIAVALRACGEVIDLAQAVREMPLEPEAPRVVVS